MKALLSILALYNYDSTIFDNMLLPDGIEKENLVNNLLLELAELEVLYSNPTIMKSAIGFWSKKELPVWTKLYNSTQFEYNPIWNQFRTEEWSDKQTRNLTGSDNETRNLTGSDNETRNLTGSDNETRELGGTTIHHSETAGETTNNGVDTAKEYVSGFNETTPTLAKQSEQTLGTGNTVAGTVDNTNTTTDTGTVNKAITDAGTVNKAMTNSGTVNKALTDEGTIENEHTAKFEGHTGIVPVQKLIEMERETVKFNTTSYIIDSFKSRFCLLIY